MMFMESLSPSKRFTQVIFKALSFIRMLIIAIPPSLFCPIKIFLAILWPLKLHRKSNRILSIRVNSAGGGDGNTESLYMNWLSSNDFITVTLPKSVNFLCDQIFIIFSTLFILVSRFACITLVQSALISIPRILVVIMWSSRGLGGRVLVSCVRGRRFESLLVRTGTVE